MTPDFGSIHGWPVRKICIFSSYPFSLKDREQTQISSNTPFSVNCQIIWRHPRTLENSGCGLTYGPSPSQADKNKRWEWRLSCSVENVQCAHTLTVGSAAPHLPQTPAANRHLQRPLLSVSLEKMNTLQRAKQSILPSRQSYANFQCNYLYSCPHYF